MTSHDDHMKVPGRQASSAPGDRAAGAHHPSDDGTRTQAQRRRSTQSSTRSPSQPQSQPHSAHHAASTHAAIVAQWARLGVGFPVAPSESTPDVERLIIETVRAGRSNARLLVMAATWLRHFGDLVARHRLAHLAMSSLDEAERAVLGWLLEESSSRRSGPRRRSSPKAPAHAAGSGADEVAPDAAQPGEARRARGGQAFREVLAICGPAAQREPVFRVHQRHPALLRRMLEASSRTAERWNLLAEPLQFKADALRSPEWIRGSNPVLASRALLRGDLRASILAALRSEHGAGASELELARRCGASRAAVREALSRLEMAGLVRRARQGRRRTVTLVAGA